MEIFIELTAYSGIAFSFFLILLLIAKSDKNLADGILIAWFIGIAGHCAYFFSIISGNSIQHPLIRSLGSALPVLHIPVIYLYSKELVNKNSLLNWALCISPFISYMCLFSIAVFNKYLIFDGFEVYLSEGAPLWTKLISPSMILIVLVFIWLIRINIKDQKLLLYQNFSNESENTLSWINHWLLTIGIGATAIILSILLADAGFFSYSVSYSIVFLFMDAQLVLVGIYGLKQTPIFVQKLPIAELPEKPRIKYEKSALTDPELEIISEKMNRVMLDDKLFLNSELSISNLAQATGFSSAQISQTLNRKIGENFFDFVNKYRVEDVKEKLLDQTNDHLSILGIAFESGFSSKSTFNKCFKRFTGITPSAFKKLNNV